MKKPIFLVLILLLAGLLSCGCKKDKTGKGAGADSGKKSGPAAEQPAKPAPAAPPMFGALAADLCNPDRIPELMVQAVDFTTRMRSTDLMLDLQDKTMDQLLEQGRAEMQALAGDMKADLAAHPFETCDILEEKVDCKDAAEDMAMGGGSLFTTPAVMDVLKAMNVASCGYITASFKLKDRQPESQKFLAGKAGGQWRLIAQMPEMR
jgi:predicted small secreted protein